MSVGAGILVFGMIHWEAEALGCVFGGRECHPSDTPLIVGTAVMASGLVFLAIGIPMLVVGSKRVPKEVALDPFTVRF